MQASWNIGKIKSNLDEINKWEIDVNGLWILLYEYICEHKINNIIL